MKKILLCIVLVFSTFFVFWEASFAWNSIFNGWTTEVPYCKWDSCWLEEWVDSVKNIDAIEWNRSASEYIQAVVKYILSFLSLVAILVIIYAWFNLLTWIWDEEKAKKTKQIIVYAVLWLVIIFLAWPIVDFVVKILNA